MSDSPNGQEAYRNLWQLLGAVFGIRARVDRLFYNWVGFSLMLFKYVVEAALIWRTTGMFFDPLTFLIPSFALRETIFNFGPQWLPWAIYVWSIPFVWIAVTMSVRRAIDSNQNPLWGMWVLVPILNLLVMLQLAFAPSVDTKPEIEHNGESENSDRKHFVYSAFLGIAVGSAFALSVTVVSANLMHNYGGSLFLGMPIVSGAAAGFVYNQPYTKGIGASLGVGALSVAIGGLGLLLFALEGVICLLMACPMLLPVGALGGLLGWFLSKMIILQSKWMLGGATMLLIPVIGLIEMATREYETHVVESSIVIDASADAVWDNVVSFPDIESAEEWYFKLGIATPLRARIEGRGVGAVRHCEFTTGSFIEPITVWDQPNRLAFDVVEQPDPMIELTPYRNIRPPHLSHTFYSVKGEFELVANTDGTTTLIGRTWYVVEMGPTYYWKFWTDEIIHRIHLRVLKHIQQTTVSLKSDSDE